MLPDGYLPCRGMDDCTYLCLFTGKAKASPSTAPMPTSMLAMCSADLIALCSELRTSPRVWDPQPRFNRDLGADGRLSETGVGPERARRCLRQRGMYLQELWSAGISSTLPPLSLVTHKPGI
eukprot:1785783-Rhodomonas_salina.2